MGHSNAMLAEEAALVVVEAKNLLSTLFFFFFSARISKVRFCGVICLRLTRRAVDCGSFPFTFFSSSVLIIITDLLGIPTVSMSLLHRCMFLLFNTCYLCH